MNGYFSDRERKEAMQAECRRLENAGYKIVSVQYGDPDRGYRPLAPFDLWYFNYSAPRIRIYR